jgi:hypothetical protein
MSHRYDATAIMLDDHTLRLRYRQRSFVGRNACAEAEYVAKPLMLVPYRHTGFCLVASIYSLTGSIEPKATFWYDFGRGLVLQFRHSNHRSASKSGP